MDLLIVGGSGWLGGEITRQALARGHRATVLSRGQAPPPEGTGSIVADRTGALPPLGRFDAAAATETYTPPMLTRLLAALGPVDRFVMISSVSVYDDLSAPGGDESAQASPAAGAEIDAAEAAARGSHVRAAAFEAYGRLKRSAELTLIEALGDRATILRPGLIVGPGDPTDRFTYWVRRADQAGPMPVPGPAERPVQVIDVRDLAGFALDLVEADRGGTFNAVGEPLPFGALIALMGVAADAGAEPVWRPLGEFTEAGLEVWSDLPLVLPEEGPQAGMMAVSGRAARAVGLRTRAVSETVADTLLWDRTRRDVPLRAGMSAKAEARLGR